MERPRWLLVTLLVATAGLGVFALARIASQDPGPQSACNSYAAFMANAAKNESQLKIVRDEAKSLLANQRFEGEARAAIEEVLRVSELDDPTQKEQHDAVWMLVMAVGSC